LALVGHDSADLAEHLGAGADQLRDAHADRLEGAEPVSQR
jgi:hypothetical protein